MKHVRNCIIITLILSLSFTCLSAANLRISMLENEIERIVTSSPGVIGVGVIFNDTDTLSVNNKTKYPMMSVFKLHQAIATCHKVERIGSSIDSTIRVNRNSLNYNTWSPMLKDICDSIIEISLRDLMRYTLIHSDNNASNILFSKIISPLQTDSLIAAIIPRATFQIKYSEDDMARDKRKSLDNFSTPLGAASLINILFTDSLLCHENQYFLKETLTQCQTGTDRIIAPLLYETEIKVAHKTGSGYRNAQGILMAHNDLAFVTLPDGSHYSLAIFVTDFPGSETEASAVISTISKLIYSRLKELQPDSL